MIDNIYSWCGDSSYTLSGYDKRTAEFQNYSIPSFFAEYGCNVRQFPEGNIGPRRLTGDQDVTPRKFTEVQALYSSPMTDVFSGGIVYMYYQEANKYGM